MYHMEGQMPPFRCLVITDIFNMHVDGASSCLSLFINHIYKVWDSGSEMLFCFATLIMQDIRMNKYVH